MSVKRAEIPTEAQEQRALVSWLSVHPVLKNYFYKNHNEGKRTPGQTVNLKRLGLRPGVSDLFIYWPTKTYHGLFLEVKRDMNYPPSARLTDTWVAQESFLETVRKVGFAGCMCYGFDDGREVITKYLAS